MAVWAQSDMADRSGQAQNGFVLAPSVEALSPAVAAAAVAAAAAAAQCTVAAPVFPS